MSSSRRLRGRFLPESGHTVGVEGWVSGDDCQALDQRGRGDEAVERVFVMQRQSGQRLDMGYLNRKKLDAVKRSVTESLCKFVT